jgi:hypothetical protein
MCVFVESPSATFVRERNPRFWSSRVSSLLLPSRRVFLASLCSCVGIFFVFHATNPSERIMRVSVMCGGRGGGMRRRASDADPDTSWSFLPFQLKGQRPPVMETRVLGLCLAMAHRGRLYKGQGLATCRPARSPRRRSIDGRADGHALEHQCSLTVHWTRPKRDGRLARTSGGEDGSTGSLPCGPGKDTKRRAWRRAWTARLSTMTQFSPIFGPGMDRSSPRVLVWVGSLR